MDSRTQDAGRRMQDAKRRTQDATVDYFFNKVSIVVIILL